jgi:transposase InsO family protein
LYLAVILDLFSRRVVGWSLSERLERGIALDAFKMALQDRKPPQGLLHHSDRGSLVRQPRLSAAAGGTRHPKQHEP